MPFEHRRRLHQGRSVSAFRWGGWLLIGCFLGLATGCATPKIFWTPKQWEQEIAFHPAKYPAGDWRPTNIVYQDVWLKSNDGTQLHGWYLPHPHPVAHALVLHGNAGNVAMLNESLKDLQQRHRLSVLAFDYRGYGRSSGTASEQGLYDDARAARKWLAEKAQIAPRDIVLIGHELGGAVATELAAEDGARGLVLVSTFTSLPAIGQRYAPLLPAGLLMQMRFDALSKIKQYDGPLLVAHGDKDEVIPYSHALQLLEAAKGKKEFITMKGNRHETPATEEYHEALDRFLAGLDAGQLESEPNGETASFSDLPTNFQPGRLPVGAEPSAASSAAQ